MWPYLILLTVIIGVIYYLGYTKRKQGQLEKENDSLKSTMDQLHKAKDIEDDNTIIPTDEKRKELMEKWGR